MSAQAYDIPTPGTARMNVYVYGILPSDVRLQAGTTGVGDPPAQVRIVREGDLAALVSDVDPTQPLGRPEDLMAHQELLDSIAGEVPVLPLRFGAVVTGDEAVTTELLAAHHEEFADALRKLEGRVEYVVLGRYVEPVIVREILAEDPRAAELAERIKNADPDLSREMRIEVGEIIANAVAVKREEDTRAFGDALAGCVEASVVRSPTHDLDAVYAAFLVTHDAAKEAERRMRRLARDWSGRIQLRLIGPLAAYDFVGAPAVTAG